MKTNKTIGTIAALILVSGIVSCTFDDSHLRDSLDDLNGRIEALEDFQSQIQSEIEILKDLIDKQQSNVTVNDIVENGDGSYTINFSDGTSATISDGEDGKDGQDGQDGQDGLTPPTIIVMEEDGTYYWGYEYPDGRREFITDDNGNKIPVTGDAPQLRINEQTGRWEYSIDGGITWKDAGPATGGASDPLFSDVSYDDDNIYITIQGGTTITIPRTKELAFVFNTDEEILAFEAGETKTVGYTMSGASNVSITKPDGWRASIESEGFVITAPSEDNAFAETEGIVSVLVSSSNGQSLIAKLAVEIAGGGDTPDPDVPDTPVNLGDFYYSDGTWSSELDASKEVIGIVFYVGDATADDAQLKADHPQATHGLAIGLPNFPGYWQQYYQLYQSGNGTVDSWIQSNLSGYQSILYATEAEIPDAFIGYQCTKAIMAFNADPANADYPASAVQSIQTYNETNTIPELSSGWFLPSMKELKVMHEQKSVLDASFSKLTAAGYTDAKSLDGTSFYLSSLEQSSWAGWSYDAWFSTIAQVQKSQYNRYRTVIAF